MSIAICLQRVKGIYGQKGRQVYAISGTSGRKIELHSTGPTEDILKLPGVMSMKAAVSNVMRIFSLVNFQRQARMRTCTIHRQKKPTNFIALTVILMLDILLRDIHTEVIPHLEIPHQQRRRSFHNLLRLTNLKVLLRVSQNQLSLLIW